MDRLHPGLHGLLALRARLMLEVLEAVTDLYRRSGRTAELATTLLTLGVFLDGFHQVVVPVASNAIAPAGPQMTPINVIVVLTAVTLRIIRKSRRTAQYKLTQPWQPPRRRTRPPANR